MKFSNLFKTSNGTKRLPKILTIFFFSIFILQMACLIFLLTIPKKTQAADIRFTPQVEIPDSKFKKVECDPKTMTKEEYEKCGYTVTGKTIGEYIQAIYNYAIGIVGILAAVVLMFGGVIWLTAGGSQEKVKEAKAWIGASLSGLILLLGSYMILNTINPDLVSFKELYVPKVEKIKDTSTSAFDAEGNAKEFCCQAQLDIPLGADKYVCSFYKHSGDIVIGEKEQWIMSEEVCRKLPLLIDRVNRASQDTTVRKTIVTFIEVSDTGGCEWNELEASGKCVVKE